MAQAVAQGMRLPFQISRQASASSKNKDEKKGKNPPPSPETLRRFAVERVKYREQMSVLRKQYASEHAERLREKERQQKAKRDLRTLEQGSGVRDRFRAVHPGWVLAPQSADTFACCAPHLSSSSISFSLVWEEV